MEIIDELEVSRRGLYGGVVGYLDFAGDGDAAIAIRTALLRDGVAYVQAGGGIVADSQPPTEDQETQNKAAAVVRAISVAERFTAVQPAVSSELAGSRGRMRSRALAFGCLLIGGALALVGSAQPWWRATGGGVVLRLSGTQATGGLSQALAIVALAGTLLMLALRTRGRRVIGALLVLVGVGLAVVGGLGLQPSADAIGSQVHEVSLADHSG